MPLPCSSSPSLFIACLVSASVLAERNGVRICANGAIGTRRVSQGPHAPTGRVCRIAERRYKRDAFPATVELGDGQVAGLPERADVGAFYRALAGRLT